ncbi:MAG: peptidase S9 [Gemmatimonadota bacterium]
MGSHRYRVVPPLAAALFALSAVVPATAPAQYFGRNKVQYETFDFRVLKTEHFDIYYYPQEREAVREAARMAERWYSRFSRLLDHQLRGRQPLILYASHPHFEQTNAIFGNLGEATGGVTEALKRRMVLPLAGPLKETDHVLGHELAHAFQFDITTRGAGDAGFSAPGALALPLWFIEGMAEYLSLGPVDPHTAMWMRDAASDSAGIPTIRQLSNPKYFPYRYGHAFWAYVAGKWGDEALGKILQVAGRSGDPEQALAAVLKLSPDSLSQEWAASIRDMYATVSERTSPPGTYGEELVSKERGGGGLNVGPAVSSDGSRFVFLSEKDLFSIELFLADATTGRIEKRLTKTASDPHFESLQFLSSAGAWSPDNRSLALAAVTKGQPALAILNVRSGRIIKEVRLPDLGEIFTPTWSPDGKRVAFSAIVDGFMDLYVLDLETEELRRLTNDAYADLQPAWSPDGASIAFVTDRFSTDLEALDYGNYRLATIDPGTREIQALPVFGRGKHIDPQWSADGQSLYFLTDVSGITNIYRYEFGGGKLYQVTNLTTGVSGITPLSPAMSVAAGASRLIYTVYEDGDYDLYEITSPEALRGVPLAGPIAGVSPAVLPPQDRQAGLVLSLLDEPTLGLVDTLTVTDSDYSSSLALDFVSQPTLGVGADRFGAFVGGGISLFFSDMLGNRNLSTFINVNSSTGNIAKSSVLVLGYENRRTRWNWGGEVGQIPLVTRGFTQGFTTLNGRDVFVDQEFRFFQVNRQAVLGVSYPFSRAQRVELSGGFRNIDFSSEVKQRVFDAASGQLISDQTIDLPSDTIPSINTAIGTAALVYDNTVFGGTGPILGQRYRLEASPSIGDLNYVGLLADYRRYFMPARPLTFAARLLHFGRYGNDGEDPRLSQLFIGYPTLVRGYNDGSFSAAECKPPPGDPTACPVFDQLLGSRLAVANFELRLPIFGFFGVVPSPAVPPIEAAIFFDAGVAWTQDIGVSFSGARSPVTSHGAAMRLNLLGLAVVEVDYVHPNDRPDKGWYWQFSLAPAF